MQNIIESVNGINIFNDYPYDRNPVFHSTPTCKKQKSTPLNIKGCSYFL